MDPSYNGTFGSGNAGGNGQSPIFGMGTPGVGTGVPGQTGVPVQPGTSVQPGMPIQPAVPVTEGESLRQAANVQPVQSGVSVQPGVLAQPVPSMQTGMPMQPAAPVQSNFQSVQSPMQSGFQQPMAPTQPVMPAQPSMPVQPMQQPMQSYQQPVGMGASDIVLAPEQGSRKKLWMIIGAVVGVAAVTGIVIAVISMVGGGGISGNTGLRGAFNKYANYFISGVESTEDIDIIKEDEEIDEASEGAGEESDETIFEEDNEEIYLGEDEDEELDSELELSEEEAESMNENDSYFEFMLEVEPEDRQEYIEKIKSYYGNFKKDLLNDLGDYDGMQGIVDDYDNKMNLVLTSRGDGELNQEKILKAYLEGGSTAAKEVISNAVSAYSELNDVFGVDFHELMNDYGQQELIALEKYEKAGCIMGGELNYTCVVNITNDDGAIDASLKVIEYSGQVAAILEDCSMELYSGIYSFADIVYNGAGLSGGSDEK